MMMSQARRSVGVSIRRRARVCNHARMMTIQSRQKYSSKAMALPTCRATTNASQNDSGFDWAFTTLFQPNSDGNNTVWPRLEMGNSSATPCSAPRTTAWKVVMGWVA